MHLFVVILKNILHLQQVLYRKMRVIMFNLRFKCTVISSWHMVLHAVPKANKMIANKNQGVWQRKYSNGQQLHNVS